MTHTAVRLALPLLLGSLILSQAQASDIRDSGNMFSPAVVSELRSELKKLEKTTNISVLIDTIESMPNAPENKDAKRRAFNTLAEARFAESDSHGIYILLSKNDHLISDTLIRKKLENRLPESSRSQIREAFLASFKKNDFDGGLKNAVASIESKLGDSPLPGPAAAPRRPNVGNAPPVNAPKANNGGGSAMATLILIGLGILAVFLVLRLLGGLMGSSSGGGGGMVRPGYGPGPGPGGYGYGGGGGGGGFFSSLFGGIGGAIAGNWMYDQFSGRNRGYGNHSDVYGGGIGGSEPTSSYDPNGDQIVGGGGEAASWDAPDTDSAGGDWSGGGGDWGGGGGDWGGGGGDSGGGGDW